MRPLRDRQSGSSRLSSAMLLLLGIGAVVVFLLQNREQSGEQIPVPTVRPTLLAELPSETPSITASPSATPSLTWTVTPTETASIPPTPSVTLFPTRTALPTHTSEPTASPFLTFTPLPPPVCETIVIQEHGAFVRSGPGTDYAPMESVPQNAIFEVMGYHSAGDGTVWYNIQLQEGASGWISQAVSEILRDEACNELAQAPTVPPTPIPVTQPPNQNSVSVYPTSNATPFCGDKVCQASESWAVCSLDCTRSSSDGAIPNDRTPFPYEQTPSPQPFYTPQFSGNPIDSPGTSPRSTPVTNPNPGGGNGGGIPFSCEMAQGVSVEECVALSSLYLGTNGQSWTNNSNWLTNLNVCAWYGVSCNACAASGGSCMGNSVYVLYLVNNNLQGQIPPNLGNLPNLQILNLGNNNLTGSVPTELSRLTQLKTLCLYGNPSLETTLPPPLDTLGCR